MHYTYDPQADALYIYLRENLDVIKTIEIDDRRNVDLDTDNKVVGVEVLSPGAGFPVLDLIDRFEPTDFKEFLESVATTPFKRVMPASS